MTDDETYCIQMINRLREDYQKAAQPYIDRLVRIRRLEMRPIYVSMDQLNGSCFPFEEIGHD